MKLISFSIFLVCISSIVCSKYCAHMDFNPKDIFDTDSKDYMKHYDSNYTKHGNNANCFVSFYLRDLPDDFSVISISDCTSKFKGRIKAGKLNVDIPKTLKKNRCYYQKDWIFCACNFTYCNSPQYWPLMLARFSHDDAPKTRKEKGAFDDAEAMIKQHNLKITVDRGNNAYRDNLRCLVWLSDTVYQEQENPPFYFYNYISTRHRTPPLADALNNTPVLRKDKDWGTIDDHTIRKIYVHEKEPFDDGTHESDHDYKTYPFEVMHDEGNSDKAMYIAAIGAVWFSVAFIGTVVFLMKICRRVQNHSEFPRTNDMRAHHRYGRCFKHPQFQKEFNKIRNKEIKKKDDMEAGPSVK